MLFHTPLFLFFFAVFFPLYSFVFLRRTPRLWLLLVGSLVFYAGWNYRFIPLLVFSAMVDYFVALGLEQATGERRRRWLLALSIATNLGVLGAFKYSSFLLGSVADLLLVFGYAIPLPTLSVVLPVGISFYTFQSMSYTIDVYRRETPARRGLLQFTAALAFFPQLVAGPILRARQILPQLEKFPTPTWEGAKHGLVLITVGLMKKTLADLLAGPVANAFDGGAASWLETWTGVVAFAGQIYGDFSGYSDIAIGVGLLMGFQIPLNFRLPYLATSPVDFWRRWHISLSSWLRDYLYISFGGSRTGHRTRNVLITMLLGGLWHGASWTFVAWGFYHGLLVAATHALEAVPSLARWASREGWGVRAIKIGGTFYLGLIGWVFFRAASVGQAWEMLLDMHAPQALLAFPPEAVVVAVLTGLTLLLMHGMDWAVLRHGSSVERRPWLLWPLLVAGQAFAIAIGDPGHAFIYFQF
jgi:D-alanyl-lipoteichoic acid acyltransferase DltB (MBOAT superfamily)